MKPVVADAINAQIGRELAAHLEYLSIHAYFHDEGLPQLGAFFRDQAAEEHAHAMRFLDYLIAAGGHVDLPAITAPRNRFESAQEAVALSLEWERSVTAHINDLVDLAVAEHDHATQVMLEWFVTEQVEEIATMDELLKVATRAGEANLLLVEEYVHRASADRGASPG